MTLLHGMMGPMSPTVYMGVRTLDRQRLHGRPPGWHGFHLLRHLRPEQNFESWKIKAS